jgi:hypothetical protein
MFTLRCDHEPPTSLKQKQTTQVHFCLSDPNKLQSETVWLSVGFSSHPLGGHLDRF